MRMPSGSWPNNVWSVLAMSKDSKDIDARTNELLELEKQTKKEGQKLLAMAMEREEQLEKREQAIIEREKDLREREKKLENTRKKLLAVTKRLKKDKK